MSPYKAYAATMMVEEGISIEASLRRLIDGLLISSRHPWTLKDIDATGNFGNQLTQIKNDGREIQLSDSEMKLLLSEDGQIIELVIETCAADFYPIRIIVRDGQSIDLLGLGTPPSPDQIGKYTLIDPHLFKWPDNGILSENE